MNSFRRNFGVEEQVHYDTGTGAGAVDTALNLGHVLKQDVVNAHVHHNAYMLIT